MRDRPSDPLSTYRRSARSWPAIVAVAVLCGALVGCSKSSSTPVDAGLRMVNATSAATLTLNLDQAAEIPSLAPGGVSGYVQIPAGSYTSSVATSDGSLSAATQLISLGSGGAYTTLAYQRNNAVVSTTFTDNLAVPAPGGASVRVANVSPDAGPLDIYIVASGTTSLTNLTPAFQNVPSGSASNPSLVTAGTYALFVTAYANQADVRFSLPSITLASTEVLTIALTSTSGGALVNATLIQQAGPAQFVPTTQSRVRLVGAFPPNGATNASVDLAVNGTTLAPVIAPSIGGYALITGGATSYLVSVNGTNVPAGSLPAATFASGGDYTVLVYGSTSAPTVAVLTDDNQTAGFDAIVRLINAAVPTGGVTLTYNFQTVASSIGYGAASAYTGVTPSSSSTLTLTSPIATFPPYNATGVNLVSSGVYTFFVLGAATSPVNVLNRDR